MFINLYIYSKNRHSLIKFLDFFFKVAEKKVLKIKIFSVFYKSKKEKTHFSILRSPHVNKKSQEQFEYCLFTKQIKIYSFQFFKLLFFLKELQITLFPDVKFKIKFLLNKNLHQNRKILNPDKFLLKNCQKVTYIKTKRITNTYLKLFDVYGELTKEVLWPVTPKLRMLPSSVNGDPVS